jgi:hypothetical protein
MESYNGLVEAVNAAAQDAAKFYEKGNKAAGTRLRKHMQEIKRIAQEIRVEVQNKKGS